MPGTVVEAELEKKHGKTVWEVEILGADGTVTEVHIDASTGAVIDTEAKKDEKKKSEKKAKQFFASDFPIHKSIPLQADQNAVQQGRKEKEPRGVLGQGTLRGSND